MARDSACEHYAIRAGGQIACRHCGAVWRIDMAGARWILPAKKEKKNDG